MLGGLVDAEDSDALIDLGIVVSVTSSCFQIRGFLFGQSERMARAFAQFVPAQEETLAGDFEGQRSHPLLHETVADMLKEP